MYYKLFAHSLDWMYLRAQQQQTYRDRRKPDRRATLKGSIRRMYEIPSPILQPLGKCRSPFPRKVIKKLSHWTSHSFWPTNWTMREWGINHGSEIYYSYGIRNFACFQKFHMDTGRKLSDRKPLDSFLLRKLGKFPVLTENGGCGHWHVSHSRCKWESV